MTQLLTMAGPQNIEDTDYLRYIHSLSDKEAGLFFLRELTKAFPDLAFEDLLPENLPITQEIIVDEITAPNFNLAGKCSGFWGCTKSFFGDVKDTTAGVIVDTLNYIGDKGGDIIRLVTDEEVIKGGTQIAAAVATKGQSASLTGLLQNLGGGFKSSTSQQVSSTSQTSQQVRDNLVNAASTSGNIGGTGEEWIKGIPNPVTIGAGLLALILVVN